MFLIKLGEEVFSSRTIHLWFLKSGKFHFGQSSYFCYKSEDCLFFIENLRRKNRQLICKLLKKKKKKYVPSHVLVIKTIQNNPRRSSAGLNGCGNPNLDCVATILDMYFLHCPNQGRMVSFVSSPFSLNIRSGRLVSLIY